MGKLQELNEGEDYNDCEEASMEDDQLSCSVEASNSSLDMVEDELSSISNGPLYELSDLMIHLPIKRGLSKYYDGKSESFTSLASVESLEDLGKRAMSPIRKKLKSWKSFGGHKSLIPRATISKKASRTSTGKSSLLCGSRSSAISVNGH